MKRLTLKFGQHAQNFHEQEAQQLDIDILEMDERHGYVTSKKQQCWDAASIDAASKFIVHVAVGPRNTDLIERLMQGSHRRLAHPPRPGADDRWRSELSHSLSGHLRGVLPPPPRQSTMGRPPNPKYRIPRTLAHVQVIKHRQGQKLEAVEVSKAHGSWQRINQALDEIGYNIPNTSTVERFNGTARRMNAHQVRRSLAFAHRSNTRQAVAWWSATVYNWVRVHRSLRTPLEVTEGKKRFQQRTPAMAVGLTEHIWTEAQILRAPVYIASQE
ncbi:hypothetical protein [Acaryochloris sp. 'Moss Beach']|uniref:hypothetical protein n=2 Tax=Acaryochloris sp. 'Moss Beach' TaxID=2740837 RepID=UPI001F2EE333|nr:hypothetical protein [Acaryochloris sp. 'Moss Beach']